MLKLLCLTGLNQGKEYAVGNQEIILGRRTDSDIHILDTKSSRHHCTIYWENASAYIKDNESQNGTFVNNIKITDSICLKNKDAVKIGDTTFQVYFSDAFHELDNLTKTLQRSPHYTNTLLQSNSLGTKSTLRLPRPKFKVKS